MKTNSAATSARAARLDKLGRATVIGGVALLVVYAIYLLAGPDREPYITIFKKGVLDVVFLSSAAACFFRAAEKRGDSTIWLAFGIGCLMEACGVLYHQIILDWDPTPPYPSPQDFFYLMVYPGWYVGMILLARRQLRDGRSSLWLHGVIGGLTVAALTAALVFDKIVNTTGDNTAAVVTNLAYPVADTMLIALLVCIVALNGFRAGKAWILILLGAAVFFAGDITASLEVAAGTYKPGNFLDFAWPVGMLLIASAGFAKASETKRINEERWMLLPSMAFATLALAIIVYGWVHGVEPAAMWLAASALAVVIVQFALVNIENTRLLRASRRDATIDAVTGLPNRRQLFEDLEFACADASDEAPAIVMLFDLNGFKAYNDRFGHMAGDVLLKRLGNKLDDAFGEYGTAYRLGGDEFCLLARAGFEHVDAYTATALAALREHGEGFETSSSCGVSVVPLDSSDPADALRIADERMYAQKHGDGSLDARQFDTVIRVIQRFAPMIDTHRAELLPIVRRTASALGVSEAEAGTIASAFEVRDVGYYAVPEEVLRKNGPLNDSEWALMKTHPVVGERLLGISPTLRGVAELVRTSHERIDGKGYPDGIPGDEIPLGARIVAVAGAFDAMVSDRPHRKPMTVGQAIAEIKRGAGSQFDPAVAEAFCETVFESTFEPHAEPINRPSAKANDRRTNRTPALN
ncbi:MAG: bifunctional diguanylate cyclase/phosphohydrolase [Solirubrobacterales bacterium]